MTKVAKTYLRNSAIKNPNSTSTIVIHQAFWGILKCARAVPVNIPYTKPIGNTNAVNKPIIKPSNGRYRFHVPILTLLKNHLTSLLVLDCINAPRGRDATPESASEIWSHITFAKTLILLKPVDLIINMYLKYLEGVYEDREDSWLLQGAVKEYLKEHKPKTILDVGTGTGIQAITAKLAAPEATVFALDLNPKACALAQRNARLNKAPIHVFCSDLLTALKPKTKFDLILFNAPYLPPKNPVDITWSGGAPLIKKFLEQAKQYLSENGAILFVFSNLTGINPDKFKIVSKQKLHFEELYVAEVKK